MKIIYLIGFLISSFIVSSQSFSTLKSRDTIYIYFDVNDKNEDLILEKIANPNNLIYRYKFSNSKFIDFEMRYENNLKKKCIRKKDLDSLEVVKSKDFINSNYLDIISELESKKITVFIIDVSKSKKKKVFLEHVKLMNKVPIEM